MAGGNAPQNITTYLYFRLRTGKRKKTNPDNNKSWQFTQTPLGRSQIMIYFANPTAFIVLLFLPFLIRRMKSTENSGIPFISGSGLTEFPKPPYLAYRNQILSILKILSLLFLITALARPQSGEYRREDYSEGRDLIITVDASGSMKALDFKLEGKPVSRLDVLKEVVKSFIQTRTGDRIGLIVFGEEVYTQSPLTMDHTLLLQYLDELEIGMAGDSTALGDALALSVKRIKDISSDSKAVILVTDGLKTSGQLEPLQAAEIARRLGVKVYTIGIGGKAPAPFPAEDMFGRVRITYLDIPVDDESLMKIAEMTGGKYFSAQNTSELERIYAEIDRLETRKDVNSRMHINREYFYECIMVGILLVIITELLSRTWLRVIS
jgi:Ca-activated chloride channel family protein